MASSLAPPIESENSRLPQTTENVDRTTPSAALTNPSPSSTLVSATTIPADPSPNQNHPPTTANEPPTTANEAPPARTTPEANSDLGAVAQSDSQPASHSSLTPAQQQSLDENELRKSLGAQVAELKKKYDSKRSCGWHYFYNNDGSFHTLINPSQCKKYVVGEYVNIGNKRGFIVRLGHHAEASRNFLSVWYARVSEGTLADKCEVVRLSEISTSITAPPFQLTGAQLAALQKTLQPREAKEAKGEPKQQAEDVDANEEEEDAQEMAVDQPAHNTRSKKAKGVAPKPTSKPASTQTIDSGKKKTPARGKRSASSTNTNSQQSQSQQPVQSQVPQFQIVFANPFPVQPQSPQPSQLLPQFQFVQPVPKKRKTQSQTNPELPQSQSSLAQLPFQGSQGNYYQPPSFYQQQPCPFPQFPPQQQFQQQYAYPQPPQFSFPQPQQQNFAENFCPVCGRSEVNSAFCSGCGHKRI
jgi:hypothetical protein